MWRLKRPSASQAGGVHKVDPVKNNLSLLARCPFAARGNSPGACVRTEMFAVRQHLRVTRLLQRGRVAGMAALLKFRAHRLPFPPPTINPYMPATAGILQRGFAFHLPANTKRSYHLHQGGAVCRTSYLVFLRKLFFNSTLRMFAGRSSAIFVSRWSLVTNP